MLMFKSTYCVDMWPPPKRSQHLVLATTNLGDMNEQCEVPRMCKLRCAAALALHALRCRITALYAYAASLPDLWHLHV